MLETYISQALYGVSYGLLLFMLAAGLTLIFSMMGVLNFAHASFYMLGAYIAYQISTWVGFWAALVLAPVALFVVGALVERWGLRRVHKWGHVPELLFTFGLSYIIVELVQVIWGRQAVPYRVPPELDGPVDWLLRYRHHIPRIPDVPDGRRDRHADRALARADADANRTRHSGRAHAPAAGRGARP